MSIFTPVWKKSTKGLSERKSEALERRSVKAIRKIRNQDKLKKVIAQAAYDSYRVEAIANLADGETLNALIFDKDRSGIVRVAAVQKVSDQAVLIRAAMLEDFRDRDISGAAIKRLSADKDLLEVAMSNSYCAWKAFERMSGAARREHAPKVVSGAASSSARRTALGEIKDEEILRAVILHDDDGMVRWEALEKSNDLNTIREAALHDPYAEVRKCALRKPQLAEDQATLFSIAQNDPDGHIRETAAGALTDRQMLARIALNERTDQPRETAEDRQDGKASEPGWSAGCRRIALNKLDDQQILAEAALRETDKENRDFAIGKINDPKLLRSIAEAETTDAKTRKSILGNIQMFEDLTAMQQTQHGRRLLEAMAHKSVEEIVRIEPIQADTVTALLFLLKENKDLEWKVFRALEELYRQRPTLRMFIDSQPFHKYRGKHYDVGESGRSCHIDSDPPSFNFRA